MGGLYLRARRASFTRFPRLSSFALQGERCTSASPGDKLAQLAHSRSGSPLLAVRCACGPPAYSSPSPPSDSRLSMLFPGHYVSFQQLHVTRATDQPAASRGLCSLPSWALQTGLALPYAQRLLTGQCDSQEQLRANSCLFPSFASFADIPAQALLHFS